MLNINFTNYQAKNILQLPGKYLHSRQQAGVQPFSGLLFSPWKVRLARSYRASTNLGRRSMTNAMMGPALREMALYTFSLLIAAQNL